MTEFKFGLEPPVYCKCGRECRIETDQEMRVTGLHCECGRDISVSGPIKLLPRNETAG